MHRTGFPVRLCKVSPKPSRAQWHLPGWWAQTCCFPVLRRGVGAGARWVWAGWAHFGARHTSLGGRCSEGGHGCCQKQLGLAALCLAGPHKSYCIRAGGWAWRPSALHGLHWEKPNRFFPSSGCCGLGQRAAAREGSCAGGARQLWGHPQGSCHCVCRQLCHNKPTQPLLCELQKVLLLFPGLTALQFKKKKKKYLLWPLMIMVWRWHCWAPALAQLV